MSDKSYVGYCSSFRFRDGGEIVKMALNADDLNLLRDNLQGDGRVRLVISKMREAKGNRTHSCYLDTWKPSNQDAAPPERSQPSMPEKAAGHDTDTQQDIPF